MTTDGGGWGAPAPWDQPGPGRRPDPGDWRRPRPPAHDGAPEPDEPPGELPGQPPGERQGETPGQVADGQDEQGQQPPVPAWLAPVVAAEQAGPPSARPSRRGGTGRGVLVVTGALLLGLVGGVVGGVLGDRLLTDRTPVTIATGASAERPSDSVAGVAARVLPSTVSIEVRVASGQGSGSGFVLREDGMIVTNNHVIAAAADGGGEITVVFADGTESTAEVVGRTSDYDLAVLRVDREGLTPLPLGDSERVVVGDPVIAVGAPLGLTSTVTTGIVSALNRPVSAGGGTEESAFINAIQTDAAINPGNSGGPLVNAVGEVIGVNSAIARSPGLGDGQAGNIGLGFAIPSAQVARTAQQLIDTGQATYPVVGVLLDRRYTGQGVRVIEEGSGQESVTPGGPAADAGIRAGDVITGFNGRPVTEPDQLIVAIRAQVPGDTVTLTVSTDGGQPREVQVTLDEAESDS